MSGTPSNVVLGAGVFSVAPLGSTMPTDATTALDAAFRDVGYTDGGVTIAYGITNEPIPVDQEFYPVAHKTTAISASVRVPMAEATVKNLALAMNAGANATNGAFEPPDPGSEVRVIGVLQTENGARWLFRQIFQSGSLEIRNAKAPEKKIITVEFRLEKPSGAKPFKVFPATDYTI